MAKLISEVLGIKYPLIQGGMAWISDAVLAAAVANAGATGVIAGGGRDGAYIEEQIARAKSLTDKPFGVNIMLMAPNKDEIIEAVCAGRPSFVTLGAGNPVPFFDKLKAAGIKVIPVVPNIKLAKRVEAAGADALVIEGMEAGGHIGTLCTMPLLTQVLPEINIPVVAAGGIADGRGIAAAMLMGAAGVQIGTRFLLAQECSLHDRAKQCLIAAGDTDSIVTGQSMGHGVRGLKNKFSLNYVELERRGTPEDELIRLATGTNRLAAVDGDVENGMVLAGQSLSLLRRIESAADIVRELVDGANKSFKQAAVLKL